MWICLGWRGSHYVGEGRMCVGNTYCTLERVWPGHFPYCMPVFPLYSTLFMGQLMQKKILLQSKLKLYTYCFCVFFFSSCRLLSSRSCVPCRFPFYTAWLREPRCPFRHSLLSVPTSFPCPFIFFVLLRYLYLCIKRAIMSRPAHKYNYYH